MLVNLKGIIKSTIKIGKKSEEGNTLVLLYKEHSLYEGKFQTHSVKKEPTTPGVQ